MHKLVRAVAARVPLTLILTRILIAGWLILDARDGRLSAAFLPLVIYAACSDYADGLVCRLMELSSVQLSLWDGYADAIFYLAVGYSLWLAEPQLLNRHTVLLSMLCILQLVSWGFSFTKFGRITSYHTYTAKAWGVALLLSVVEALTLRSGVLVPVMVLMGVVCLLEEIAITNVMLYWKTGVVNLRTARRLRATFKPASA